MEGFAEISDAQGSPVLLKKLEGENTTVVLCRSLGRTKKESAIASQGTERFLADIEALRASINKGTISKTQAVSERIGRIKSKYPSAHPNYEITLTITRTMARSSTRGALTR